MAPCQLADLAAVERWTKDEPKMNQLPIGFRNARSTVEVSSTARLSQALMTEFTWASRRAYSVHMDETEAKKNMIHVLDIQ